MDAARSRVAPDPDLAPRAQALIRSLAGVASARVTAGPAGIQAIHVVAADHHAAESLPRNVRSALLAGLAVTIGAASITVRVHAPDAAPAPDGHRTDAGTAAATLRLVDPAPAGDDDASPGEDAAEEPAPAGAPAIPAGRARLVAVDIERRGNADVGCRVSIAWDTQLYHGNATAAGADDTGAHAAVRATLDALASAGLRGLRLEGVRQVAIGERDYMVVALSRGDERRRYRAGSAPCSLSPERTAAQAALDAAHELT